jgi:MFS family permease
MAFAMRTRSDILHPEHRATRRLRPIASCSSLGLVLAPGIALAGRLGQAAGDDIPWWRVAGALAVCVILAVAAAAALRLRLRMRGQAPGHSPLGPAPRQLKLVESLRLSHQVNVCLVACGERLVLVATSPQGAVLLAGDVAPKGGAPC